MYGKLNENLSNLVKKRLRAMVVQCIYWQGLGTFDQNDTVAL